MSSAYEQLKNIVESIAEKTKDDKYPLFTIHKNDLYVHDKDIILNDAQAGDTYISIVRSSGAGTNLFRLTGSEFDTTDYLHVFAQQDSKSIFHKLYFTGIDEATISQITYDEAVNLVKTVSEPTGRAPRRTTIHSVVVDALGGDYNGARAKFFDGLKLEKGDKFLLKLETRNTDSVACEITSFPNQKSDAKPIKKSVVFYAPAIYLKVMVKQNDKENIYLVDVTENGYGTKTNIDESMYKKLSRKFDKLKVNEPGPEPSL